MGYINAIIILAGINIVAALGVAILTGYTGLFTIGHAGFMALGGYMSAILVKELAVPAIANMTAQGSLNEMSADLLMNLAFFAALLIGGLFAGLCSFIIGYPAFRGQLRGDYFAIATLGFAESIRLVLNNTYPIVNGAFGYQNIPQLTTVPVVLLAVALALYFSHMFVTSQWGKNCIAVGQDEVAAQMMGVNLMKTKLTSLFISAFYCGVAGGLLGFYMAFLSPSFFSMTQSSTLLASVVFGGIQSLIGPVITGFVLIAVPELLRQFAEWRLVIYGFLFVIVMIFRPQGLLGYREMNIDFIRRWWARRTTRKPLPASEGAAGGKGPLS